MHCANSNSCDVPPEDDEPLEAEEPPDEAAAAAVVLELEVACGDPLPQADSPTARATRMTADPAAHLARCHLEAFRWSG